jgi:hypothetical protein
MLVDNRCAELVIYGGDRLATLWMHGAPRAFRGRLAPETMRTGGVGDIRGAVKRCGGCWNRGRFSQYTAHDSREDVEALTRNIKGGRT